MSIWVRIDTYNVLEWFYVINLMHSYKLNEMIAYCKCIFNKSLRKHRRDCEFL